MRRKRGHFDVADILVRYHADVNALDDHGTAPALMEACHARPWNSQPDEKIIRQDGYVTFSAELPIGAIHCRLAHK